MDSSCNESDGPENRIMVPVICEEAIMQWVTQPMDLLKVDIEGAEFDLVQSYRSLLGVPKWLVLEWHTVPGIENPRALLLHELETMGFRLIDERLNEKRQPPSGVFLMKKNMIP